MDIEQEIMGCDVCDATGKRWSPGKQAYYDCAPCGGTGYNPPVTCVRCDEMICVPDIPSYPHADDEPLCNACMEALNGNPYG